VDVSLYSEKRTVQISRNGQIVGVIPCVDRCEQMFPSIFDPSHRMLDLQCDRGDGNVLSHNAFLAAEAATDIRSDDANRLFGATKERRKREAFDVTALG